MAIVAPLMNQRPGSVPGQASGRWDVTLFRLILTGACRPGGVRANLVSLPNRCGSG
jgi:hypothetical protein